MLAKAIHNSKFDKIMILNQIIEFSYIVRIECKINLWPNINVIL